jgi:hypothetical protein
MTRIFTRCSLGQLVVFSRVLRDCITQHNAHQFDINSFHTISLFVCFGESRRILVALPSNSEEFRKVLATGNTAIAFVAVNSSFQLVLTELKSALHNVTLAVEFLK